jgi:hypothetical protein
VPIASGGGRSLVQRGVPLEDLIPIVRELTIGFGYDATDAFKNMTNCVL